jgi:hypothetical protein
MYEAPSDHIFNEMKNTATEIWKGYDNSYGYVDEKLDRIDPMQNIQDNAMVFYRMFDWQNQVIFLSKSSEETREYIIKNS